MPCEKLVGPDSQPCGQPASATLKDSTGTWRSFCKDHLWESSPSDGEHPCEMLVGTPVRPCGKPSVVRHTNPIGEEHWWCEAHRREFWPTEVDRARQKAQNGVASGLFRVVTFALCVTVGWLLWEWVGKIIRTPISQLTIIDIGSLFSALIVALLLLRGMFYALSGE